MVQYVIHRFYVKVPPSHNQWFWLQIIFIVFLDNTGFYYMICDCICKKGSGVHTSHDIHVYLKGQCDGTKPFKYCYNICKHNTLRNVMNYIMNW